MGLTGVCILLATIDVVCGNIVSEMLKLCSYEELYSGEPLDALDALCEAKSRIRVVVTNLERIDAQITRDMLYHIRRKVYMNTFSMSPNGQRFELTGPGGFVVYLVTSFNDNRLSDFWKISSVSGEDVSKAIAATTQAMASLNRKGTPGASSSSAHVPADEPRADASGRVVWTDELERKFLRAIHTLDAIRKQVPAEILTHMGVKWLKRKSVASHLQKYRLRIAKMNGEAPENREVPSADPNAGLDLPGEESGNPPREMPTAYGGITLPSSTGMLRRPQQPSTYTGFRLSEDCRAIGVLTSTSPLVVFPPPAPTTSGPTDSSHQQPPLIPSVLYDVGVLTPASGPQVVFPPPAENPPQTAAGPSEIGPDQPRSIPPLDNTGFSWQDAMCLLSEDEGDEEDYEAAAVADKADEEPDEAAAKANEEAAAKADEAAAKPNEEADGAATADEAAAKPNEEADGAAATVDEDVAWLLYNFHAKPPPQLD